MLPANLPITEQELRDYPGEPFDWRTAAVAEARTWAGTPFAHQQRLKHVGADCAQWISAVYERVLGWPAQQYGNYPAHWMKHGTEDRYMDHVRRLFETPELADRHLPGSLVVFRFGRFFSHGAIITAWPCVIHADAETARMVVEEDLTKAPLGRRPRQFWTPKLSIMTDAKCVLSSEELVRRDREDNW